MAVTSAEHSLALVIAVGAHVCAVPVEHVEETMRPLPVEPLAGTPRFLLGLSVIRGAATPIVDLGMLLDPRARSARHARFVVLKVGEQRIGVGVDFVVGVQRLDIAKLSALPPIVRDVRTDYIEAVGSLDTQLLMVLRTSRIIPEDVWAELRARVAGAR